MAQPSYTTENKGRQSHNEWLNERDLQETQIAAWTFNQN